MKADKSPGLDGLPCEFYKYFWKQVRPYFYDALKEIFDKYAKVSIDLFNI